MTRQSQLSSDQTPARNLLVVGDRFMVYSALHSDVITYTTFEATKSRSFDGERLEIALGQGLSRRQRQKVASHITGHGDGIVGLAEPASARETHKHEERNILISRPRKVASDLFELDLLIDDRCSDLSDHQTGQHISGMTLVEAGRQAFLAVTERYFIPEGESKAYYFVTHRKQATFRRFAFPLPTILRYEITHASVSDRRHLSFEVLIKVFQAGHAVAELDFSFGVYQKDFLKAKEHEKASRSLAEYFADPTTVLELPLQTLATMDADVSTGDEPNGEAS